MKAVPARTSDSTADSWPADAVEISHHGTTPEESPEPNTTADVRQQVLTLKKKLEEAATEFGRLQTGLASQQQLENLLKQGRAHLQDLRSRLQQTIAERDQTIAERDQMMADLDQAQGELNDFRIAHDREIERLQSQIQDAAAQALLQRTMAEQREEELRGQIDSVRHELQRMTTERDRLTSDLEEREASHKRFAEERDEERSTFERVLAEATSNQREMMQELDEQRQQIQTLREAAMRAQSLARQIMRAHESLASDPPEPDQQ